MLEDILKEYNAEEVEALKVYSEIFHFGEGYLQHYKKESHDHKANPLGYSRRKGAKHGKYRILFEDTFEDTLKELQEADFAILNGLSYFGRRNKLEHASKLFCLIFDIDGITDKTLNNLLYGTEKGIYPAPNYIALSGNNIHLYFLLEKPVDLYPKTKIQLKKLKYALTDRLWNQYTSELDQKQFQGLNQGFRLIGGRTKIEGVRVRAFSLNKHPFSVEDLNDFVPEESKVNIKDIYDESKVSLDEAKIKYPEWYEKVIVKGEKAKGHWTCKEDLYRWWIKKIKEGAVFGHRYFCEMCLAIYATKSGVSDKQLKKDAFDLIPFLNDLSPENPFTEDDVKSALECYDLSYCRFPIEDIVKISGIEIKKNKRNGRKQKTHLRIARNTLEVLNDEAGKHLQGRKSKGDIVREWRSKNPEGKKADCIRETGLSNKTVYRHWNP